MDTLHAFQMQTCVVCAAPIMTSMLSDSRPSETEAETEERPVLIGIVEKQSQLLGQFGSISTPTRKGD